jgi:anti-sigma regulatory factor (Ser/Thr protein kinase)
VKSAERNGLDMLQLNTLVPNPATMGSVTVHSTTMTYPGTLTSVSAARHKVRDFLCRSPRVDEAELIAAELMSNAILHTPSGAAGGTFTITVKYGADWARIEVFDLGTETWHCVLDDGSLTDDIPVSGFAECGRGLRIVAMIAGEYGHEVSGSQGQTCWATVTW